MCGECLSFFIYSAELNVHVSLNHSGEYPDGSIFGLKKHEILSFFKLPCEKPLFPHLHEREKRFRCGCGTAYAASSSLVNHIKLRHNSVAPVGTQGLPHTKRIKQFIFDGDVITFASWTSNHSVLLYRKFLNCNIWLLNYELELNSTPHFAKFWYQTLAVRGGSRRPLLCSGNCEWNRFQIGRRWLCYIIIALLSDELRGSIGGKPEEKNAQQTGKVCKGIAEDQNHLFPESRARTGRPSRSSLSFR